MENDCIVDHRAPEMLGCTNESSPCWAWIYELRPPSPAETIRCKAGGVLNERLMQAAADPEAQFDGAMLFEEAQKSGDPETACAAINLGMNSVLEAGRDFREYHDWLVRANQFLASRNISLIGRSAILMQTAIAQLLGPCQLDDVRVTINAFGDAAERADSDAQRIVCASLRGYSEVMSGRLRVADAIVRDALHISPGPDLNPFPKMHLQATLGLINTLRNNLGDARECLESLSSSPDFDRLPSSLWLLSMGHRLLSLAVANNQPAITEAVADRIRARSIPSHKNYHRSYTHYALGAAALLGGQPETALFHAETAIDMGNRCHCSIAEQNSTLLAIQALADLGQRKRAMNLLEARITPWKEAGAHLLIASGALEEARIQLDLGRQGQARAALDRARANLPAGEPLPCNLRREEFISALLDRLTREPSTPGLPQPDARPVQITTFGELCVEINGKRLYDRDWHGKRSKSLLKALIVLGGYKVSAERLCDMLWPDADGDIARNNLKVALWRLRRLGCPQGTMPLPWVAIQHGHVSLVERLCRIDCIEFERELNAARASGDPLRLYTLLSVTNAPFCFANESEIWSLEYRETIRRSYLDGICTMAEFLQNSDLSLDPTALLEIAHRLEPADKRCQQLLARQQSGTA